MNRLNTIFDANFDIGITTEPNYYDTPIRNPATVIRGVFSVKSMTHDLTTGLMERLHFSPDSYDGYIVTVVSTSQSDMDNIVKALKKSASTYSGGTDENIIQWDDGVLTIINNMRYVYAIPFILRKAGIESY